MSVASGQSRGWSWVESCMNIVVGYGAALATQLIVFPLMNIHIPLHSNLVIGAIFTGVSLVRSYLLRRLFNHLNIIGEDKWLTLASRFLSSSAPADSR